MSKQMAYNKDKPDAGDIFPSVAGQVDLSQIQYSS
jgi:hypothetical protein